jgi:hypothetical protein
VRCPICKSPAPKRAENPNHPFCSERCRLADLGKWLSEDYRIAGSRLGDEPPPGEAEDGEGE